MERSNRRRLSVRTILAVVGALALGTQLVIGFQIAPAAARTAVDRPPKPSPHVTHHDNHGLHGRIVPGKTHDYLRPNTRPRGSNQASQQTPPPTADDDLAYQGGPVMQAPTTYLIFWAPGAAVISDATRQLEEQFLTDLGGSYYGILGQYYDYNQDGTPDPIQALTHFGGAWTDSTNTYPHAGTADEPLTDSDIQDEVVRAINANPAWAGPGLSTLYEVVVGQGVEFCGTGSGCTTDTLCAYHGHFTDAGADVIYANDGNQAGRNGCGGLGSGTSPNDADADADVSVLSHETFEAISNPLWDSDPAWNVPSGKNHEGDEIGDLCNSQFGNPAADGTNLTLGGHRYRVQEEWSNREAQVDPTADYAGCYLASGALQPSDAESDYAACSQNTLTRNDDGSTDEVALPFSINFFSKTFSSLWVNNNGNVTFDGPQWIYTPYGLQATNHEIIAPFFADVDTRDLGSNVVTYGGDTAHDGRPAYFCVDWVDVGYYGSHSDRLNSFQLLLIDRSAEAGGVPGDFDIVFNYDKIQWETGDASGGVGGLGGNAATAGYSNGTNAALELPGSGTTRAFNDLGTFLDDGAYSLTQSSLGSSSPGRYIFPVRNATSIVAGTIEGVITTDLVSRY